MKIPIWPDCEFTLQDGVIKSHSGVCAHDHRCRSFLTELLDTLTGIVHSLDLRQTCYIDNLTSVVLELLRDKIRGEDEIVLSIELDNGNWILTTNRAWKQLAWSQNRRALEALRSEIYKIRDGTYFTEFLRSLEEET
jgi:hypothetical protein